MSADFLLSPTTPLTTSLLRRLLATTPRITLPADAYAPAPTGPTLLPAELQAHACGTGTEVPGELVRLLLLLRVRSLPLTAVTAATAQRLLDFYNREILPVVYQQGGDAVAMAHVCLPLLGQGEVLYQGYRLQAADVLHLFSWAPLTLTVAEATALLAGAPLLLTYAVHGLLRTEHLSRAAMHIAILRPTEESEAHAALASVTHDALADVQRVVEAACNAQEPVEEAILELTLDTLRLTAVRIGELAAQRVDDLLATTDAASALRYLQLPTADIRRQNRQLASAATLREVVDNVEQLLALELLVAAQLPTEEPEAPLVAAFRHSVLSPHAQQLPAAVLRAAAAFVRGYEWP